MQDDPVASGTNLACPTKKDGQTPEYRLGRVDHENQNDVRLVRHLGGGVLGFSQETPLHLPGADARRIKGKEKRASIPQVERGLGPRLTRSNTPRSTFIKI